MYMWMPKRRKLLAIWSLIIVFVTILASIGPFTRVQCRKCLLKAERIHVEGTFYHPQQLAWIPLNADFTNVLTCRAIVAVLTQSGSFVWPSRGRGDPVGTMSKARISTVPSGAFELEVIGASTVIINRRWQYNVETNANLALLSIIRSEIRD